MAATVGEAELYFATQVLHNEEWVNAEPAQKQRAINNAKAVLYRVYKNRKVDTNPIEDYAIFEQAIWLLRVDDAVRRAEQGVNSISVNGIQVSVERLGNIVAPQAALIIGRRVGRTV